MYIIRLFGRLFFSLFVCLFAVIPVFSQSSPVVRGPYLNVGTPTSMTIRWRTITPEVGQVRIGTEFANWTKVKKENEAVTDHEVQISGLKPGTRYFYQVGNPEEYFPGQDQSYHFQTSPEPGSTGPLRIWAIGDFGVGSPEQKAVARGYLQHKGEKHTDAWLWLGDNAYNIGTDYEFQKRVFEMYPEIMRNTVIWPSPGNHDYGSVNYITHDAPYYDIFTMPTQGEAGGLPSGSESFYSFDYGNVHFVSLTSEWTSWIQTPGGVMQEWLEADLQQNKQDFTIVFWHQPPYSRGTHDSDLPYGKMGMMRRNINPICEKYGVDLVLTGHSHNYERSYLINGHYGTANTFNRKKHVVDGSSGKKSAGKPYVKYKGEGNNGTVYAVVGHSARTYPGLPLNHPVHYFTSDQHIGSLVIEVNDQELHAKCIDQAGQMWDEFNIIKKERK